MVKLAFNSALAQKDESKEAEHGEVLIVPLDEEPGDVVPIGQRRAWCWCMCFGLVFMLAGVIFGGAYLYKYVVLQQRNVFFCAVDYSRIDLLEPSASDYHSIKESFEILEEEDVELVSVPVPEFGDSDPAQIVHDFSKNITAYLDLSLDKCYVIPLNTSVVMPPRSLLGLLKNLKAGIYSPHMYLVREEMIVTEQIENMDHLGVFVFRMCHGKETYKLERRETTRGIQKREVENCHSIRHFESTVVVETVFCN
ncbi:integral membrane protein 2B [Rhinatrema bivittatum]|uniref:integral membrane protein 2B n=1 Tax=Rhinatrema bivittatum TaxID=194408 RepID=UPI0011291653|nr:integral membrane protein 2B [Rhinatrema bivittatum]